MLALLSKLKQPQVISLIALIIIQIAARYGYTFSSETTEDTVLKVLDGLTVLTGLYVAHRSDKNSVI
jgi:hypothetical protein